MSEHLPAPDLAKFPDLDRDPSWIREIPTETAIARIVRTSGAYPCAWHEFRSFGPIDARFDPHPDTTAEHPGYGVLYGVLESKSLPHHSNPQHPVSSADQQAPVSTSPFATALLEVFQSTQIISPRQGSPVFAIFETTRPLRLLDLSDSDWITVAGGNGAISSGDRAVARHWARAIAARYPTLDGVVSASSVVPNSRIVALWHGAETALPRHPLVHVELARPELAGIIDAVAERYNYLVL